VVCSVCCFFTACGMLSPQEQQTSLQVLDGMLKNGSITKEQYDALVQIVLQGGSVNWWAQLGSAVSGAALAYFGIRQLPPSTVANSKIRDLALKPTT